MTTVNPSIEVDTQPLSGLAAMRPRGGGGRHLEKATENFPDVLTSTSLSENIGGKTSGVRSPTKKTNTKEGDADDESIEKNKSVEEKVPQSLISLDVNQYLQKQIKLDQNQSDVNELAAPVDSAAELLSTLISKISNGDANAQAVDANSLEQTSKNVKGFGAAKLHEQKAIGSGEIGDDDGGSIPILSDRLTVMKNRPDRSVIDHSEITDVEVKVIKIETSFAPASPSSFVTQFAKAITGGLDGPVRSTAAIAGNPVLDPRRDMVKSIQIQLHPDDLGKIKVAMHLRGDELRLKIEVTNKEAETLLLNNHQVLKDLMSHAGYDVNDASISVSLNLGAPNPPQRDVAACDFSQESLIGQGSKQHSGASEENRNQFQNMRGPHATTSEFDDGQETGMPAVGPASVGRGSGVFL